MTLTRRIYLYLVGIIIGGVAAYAIYGDRVISAAWTPKAKVKQRLQSTLIAVTPEAQAALDERSLQLIDVRKALATADINLSDTQRGDDSIFYAVDAVLNGAESRLTILALRDFDTDSTATLWRIQ